MKVLFDQGTPAPLRNELEDHDVSTAHEMGWSMLENGALLAEAEKFEFDVFVTTDRNLQYQQNLSDRKISIVVISTTSWPRIKAVSNLVVGAIREASDNSFVEIEIPQKSS